MAPTTIDLDIATTPDKAYGLAKKLAEGLEVRIVDVIPEGPNGWPVAYFEGPEHALQALFGRYED
jgi:hypothetical protein